MAQPIQLLSEALGASGSDGGRAFEITAYPNGAPTNTFKLQYIDHGNGMCSFRINSDQRPVEITLSEASSVVEIVLKDYTMTCSLHDIPCIVNGGNNWYPATLRFVRGTNLLTITYSLALQSGTEVDPEFYITMPTAILPPPVPYSGTPVVTVN